MLEKIELIVDGKKLTQFMSYTVDSDLFMAADAWSVEVPYQALTVKPGMTVKLYVNEQQELTGLVDGVTKRFDKRSGRTIQIVGRDLMGLLVDSYVEEFSNVENMDIRTFTERLLAKMPFVKMSDIGYESIFAGKVKGHSKKTCQSWGEIPHVFISAMPGQRIYEVLKSYAESRGILFYALPSGKLVFARPRVKGEPLFFIYGDPNSRSNTNYLECEDTENIQSRYSLYRIIGQQNIKPMTIQEISAVNSAGARNISATVTDKEFPFHKPFVAVSNADYQSPALRARLEMEKALRRSKGYTYTMQGHSQNGRNFMINEFCRIEDKALDVQATQLILKRTFKLDRQTGPTTLLHLGAAGLIDEE